MWSRPLLYERLTWPEVRRAAAEERVCLVPVLPPIPHGYSPHHMDFPGPITIGWDTFTR
jgi:creatinine amidohydrolase/Fe(II)-dependent formamide hydrolase-like protein